MFRPEVTTSSAHMETQKRHGSFRGDTLYTSASDREVTQMYCVKKLQSNVKKFKFKLCFLVFNEHTLCTFEGKCNIHL